MKRITALLGATSLAAALADAPDGGLHRDSGTGGNGHDTSAPREVRSSIP
jgi:hypothetical protein